MCCFIESLEGNDGFSRIFVDVLHVRHRTAPSDTAPCFDYLSDVHNRPIFLPVLPCIYTYLYLSTVKWRACGVSFKVESLQRLGARRNSKFSWMYFKGILLFSFWIFKTEHFDSFLFCTCIRIVFKSYFVHCRFCVWKYSTNGKYVKILYEWIFDFERPRILKFPVYLSLYFAILTKELI